MSRRRLGFVLAVSAAISSAVAAGPLQPASADAATVTIAGSLQSELGCPGDWQPECANTHLTYDAADDVWQGTFPLPAGSYEYKAALNGTWDENYGANAILNGANVPLVLDGDASVKFYFDDATNWVTDNASTVIAVAPGDFQSELGCPGDWDPSCLRSWLKDVDGDGLHRFSTSGLPVGSYQFKVAIDEGWDENYGPNGVRGSADNMAFTITAPGDTLTITYNERNHMTRVSVVPAAPTVVDDGALVSPPVRHPVVDEVLYFAIPDRYFDGNTANNCGFYTPTCTPYGTQEEVLANGYLPSQQGYYHGGDLAGLRAKLPYLDELGMTAIWVGPIFANKPTQSDTSDLYEHSAGYHGYWITDFLNVDPHLGTNDDFRQLVDEAHAMGIEVFMDVVTNHTADVIQLVDNGGYRNKRDFPYTDTSGQPFDDSDYAYAGQDDYDFPDVDITSFPYEPVVPAGETKNPSWLNDPTLYHNRGNTSFVGENSLYGDFFGLDDLWTERREVVEGMVDIYSHWIEEYGVDGFRIDTTKHVNMEFWQVFGPDIVAAAAARGIDDFFAFGEVFDQQFGSPFMSEFSTEGKLQSTIDFGFQVAARGFASRGAATDDLRTFFESDDYYTDADSNAYAQPTFLGNHDMGRIGLFLKADASAGETRSDAELLARSKLAHSLMFFSRGQPVVYYGDEQGFTGSGGDKAAREDMFANEVIQYAGNDNIGTDETSADDNFDTNHPLFKAIRSLATVHERYPALRSGAQIHRFSADGPGIYAFSRIDRDEKIEFVVAFNNSESSATAAIPTYSASNARYQLVSGPAAPKLGVRAMLRTNGDGSLNVTVPPLGFVIYRAKEHVPASLTAPGITITTPQDGQTLPIATDMMDGQAVDRRVEVRAELDADVMAEVTFVVSEDGGDYRVIGTDDNAPFRVFYDPSHLRGNEDTSLTFRAIVDDLSGHLAADQVVDVGVEFSAPDEEPSTSLALIHYQRDDGDYGDHTTGNSNDFWGLHLWGNGLDVGDVTDWTSPKPFLGEDEYGRFAWVSLTDMTQPVNFIVHRGDTKDTPDDRSFDPVATPEIWLHDGDAAVYASQAEAQGYATVHYECTAPCAGVTIDATTNGSPVPVDPPTLDDYGADFRLRPTDFSAPITVTVEVNGTPDVVGQMFTPVATPSAWLQAGEQVVYESRGAAEDFALLHYRRPAGDYGDYASSDFNDFWGVHTWNGALAPTGWPTPLKRVGEDVFGVVFRIDLVDDAAALSYIIHRGDTKDPGADQSLVFDAFGHEAWQLQAADPDDPYVAPLRE